MSQSSINLSDYNKLVSHYENNKDKDWNEWLEFDSTFEKPGKQGLVGLFKLKHEKDLKCVFKISQYINYLAQHENTIMEGLNEISSYCPHFCKSFGTIICKVDPKSRKEGNPFNSDTKYPIEKEVLLCEYIEKSCKFYNYIRAEQKITESILYSTIKQVLMAIVIAQRKKNFTHYDLHSNNVMMRRCNKDLVFLYVIDKDNQFCVPTHGHYPVIIDYGFSYIENMEDGPLWASMGHTNVGFMSDRFDWVADPKLFLVTVSREIKHKRETKKAKKLRRIIRNIFCPLKIDWDCGWDDTEEHKAAGDYVNDLIYKYNKKSKLFREYEHYCIDILQTLVVLPLEKQPYEDIHVSYQAFINQWVKIEDVIASPFYNLYVLKGLIDAARDVRAAYMDEETRKYAIKTFQTRIKSRVDEVAKFCVLKNIHYEKMLCSLYVFARNMEGALFETIENRMKKKEKEYSKLPLNSTEQVYGAIECNFPDEYVYNENTNVFIVDSINDTCTVYKIPGDQLQYVNDIHPMARGTFIYDLFNTSTNI
jgi:hypothetical protein